MKKTIITACALLMSLFAIAQVSEKEKEDFTYNAGKWELAASFGSINFDNTDDVNVKDNINVGVNIDITRKFENNFFITAGGTFSTGDKLDRLWENPVKYYSGNLSVGYRIQTGGLTEGYISAGSSYISAIKTIPNADSSISGNITGGFIFWLRDSNFGLTIQDTYKIVNSDFMVSHNQITVGLAYKL